MLKETLAFLRCTICDKPTGYRTIPICRTCLKQLPPPKRPLRNLFIAFSSEVELPPSLLAALAASRYYGLGGKTDGVLQKGDKNLVANIAWHLRVPLVEYLNPNTLIIDKDYKGKQLLDSVQYLYLYE